MEHPGRKPSFAPERAKKTEEYNDELKIKRRLAAIQRKALLRGEDVLSSEDKDILKALFEEKDPIVVPPLGLEPNNEVPREVRPLPTSAVPIPPSNGGPSLLRLDKKPIDFLQGKKDPPKVLKIPSKPTSQEPPQPTSSWTNPSVGAVVAGAVVGTIVFGVVYDFYTHYSAPKNMWTVRKIFSVKDAVEDFVWGPAEKTPTEIKV